MARFWLTGTFLVCLFSGFPLRAATLHYEPVGVQVVGKLIIEHHFGAPNFGETPSQDKKESVPVLRLDEPVDVVGDPQSLLHPDSFKQVSRIQLIAKPSSYNRFINRHVAITGTLFQKENAEHYTDVLIEVRSIAKVE